MKKILLSLILFCAFAQFGFSQIELPDCQELFISEYVEGSNKNRVLEIYNPSQGVIDLSNYSLKIFTAGPNNPNVLQLMGFLPPLEVHVCGHPQADPTGILPKCDATSNEIKFDGNDAIGLYKNDTLIDVIGVIGVNPGNTGWMVGAGFTKNNTLVRSYDIKAPTPYWTISQLQWEVFPNDDTLHLGKHESVCAEPTVRFVTKQSFHNEGDGSGIVHIKITGNTQVVGPVLVPIINGGLICPTFEPPPDTNDPDAACPDDFMLVPFLGSNNCGSWVQTFSAGVDIILSMDLQLVDDEIFEGTETYCLMLTDPNQAGVQYSLGTNFYHQIVIFDNDPPTGIEEQMQINIKVYPTITEGKLFIEMKKHEDEVDIGIYNSFGQLVKRVAVNGHDGIIELSVNELSRGMYVISLEGERWTVARKFIRN